MGLSLSPRPAPLSLHSNRRYARATKRRRLHRSDTGALHHTGSPAASSVARIDETACMYFLGPSKAPNKSPVPGFPMHPWLWQMAWYPPSSCGPCWIVRDPSPFPSLKVKPLFSENSRWKSSERCLSVNVVCLWHGRSPRVVENITQRQRSSVSPGNAAHSVWPPS